ncbi:MAG: MptD family putative ECF transporter S component, partial [Lachnospiraceae bacterium]|nr:MptD family putative ECF transporter S component [Lachnospiraceae bacterium]
SVLPGFILAICAALAAEVILWLGKYRSRVMYLLSFVFFNINMTGPFLRFLYNKDAFIADTVSYYGEEHAQALSAITPEWVFWGILAGAIVGGIIGSFIANRLIKKHFEKAGVV